MDEHRRERVHRAVNEAAEPPVERRQHQRDVGFAIGLLALVVVALLIAVVTGATGALRP